MQLLDRLRRALRSSPAWVSLRRMQREGWMKAFRRVHTWRRVLSTLPTATAPHGSRAAAEVHLLCCRWDYLSAIWALKTFYYHSGVDFPLVIHVNGTVPARVPRRLRAHFPNARLILQDEANRTASALLEKRGLRRLCAARAGSAFMLKLTDFALFAAAPAVIGLDSDVLFFSRPDALVGSVEGPGGRHLFQRDLESTYNISAEDAQRDLGVKLMPRINTGIMCYPVAGLDLALCERYMENPAVARLTGFIEQTLYALHASEKNLVDYLPTAYLVDLRPGLPYDGVVARHYAGPSRPLLTSEGIPLALRGGLFAGAQV
jgi:hypothetical protein